MEQLRAVLLVGAGGAVGSSLRYLVGLWLGRVSDGRFPWGTLTVNLLGSLLLAILIVRLDTLTGGSERLRLAVGIGLLGGFTTYSTFNFEVLALVRSGHAVIAWVYMAVTIVGALLLGFLAIWLMK